MDNFTARELRAAASVTPEVLDYWQRTELVVPDSLGGYSARSVSLAVVLSEAARLGAPGPMLAQVAHALAGPTKDWPTDLYVTSHGDVRLADDAPAALVLHVRRVMAAAGPMLHHALSAA